VYPNRGRKNVVAAKAIDSPSATHTSFRSPLPPSLKAIAKPHSTIAATPTIWATGPVSDVRNVLRGASQGAAPPAVVAKLGAAAKAPTKPSSRESPLRPCRAGKGRKESERVSGFMDESPLAKDRERALRRRSSDVFRRVSMCERMSSTLGRSLSRSLPTAQPYKSAV